MPPNQYQISHARPIAGKIFPWRIRWAFAILYTSAPRSLEKCKNEAMDMLIDWADQTLHFKQDRKQRRWSSSNGASGQPVTDFSPSDGQNPRKDEFHGVKTMTLPGSVPLVTRPLLPFIKTHYTDSAENGMEKELGNKSHQLTSSSVPPWSKELISKRENNWLFWNCIIPLYFCQVSNFTAHCYGVRSWKNLLLHTQNKNELIALQEVQFHVLCLVAVETFGLIGGLFTKHVVLWTNMAHVEMAPARRKAIFRKLGKRHESFWPKPCAAK